MLWIELCKGVSLGINLVLICVMKEQNFKRKKSKWSEIIAFTQNCIIHEMLFYTFINSHRMLTFTIRRILIQTPLRWSARLWDPTCHETLGDPWVEQVIKGSD